VLYRLRLDASPALGSHVRIDASGLLQRHKPWIVPSYDANFALIIVSGAHRHDTLERLLTTLETALHVEGNAALHTNLSPIIGLLMLMRALPPETAFRTDTSLVWTALAAVVEAQKHTALALLPVFPRRLEAHQPARFARVLRATLEAGFAQPSRLLTYYLKRLTRPSARPLTPLEVLWDLAEELHIPLFEEERQQQTALRQAIERLWGTLSAAGVARLSLPPATATPGLDRQADFARLCQYVVDTTGDMTPEACAELLQDLLAWLSMDVPPITTVINILESTQLHTLLTVNPDLSITRPAYLEDATTLAHLHRLLGKNLRPAMLRHGELLSPMEATIYHQPEPGTPPFVEIGAEIAVGQTLALLEAMKMFTELPSPVDGVLVDILVDNGQGVKTGTPLFKIATQEAALETADDLLHGVIDTVFQNRFGLLRPDPAAATPP
jgi:biotin carboxyl carrier protein